MYIIILLFILFDTFMNDIEKEFLIKVSKIVNISISILL